MMGHKLFAAVVAGVLALGAQAETFLEKLAADSRRGAFLSTLSDGCGVVCASKTPNREPQISN